MRFLINTNGFYFEAGKGTVSGGESASDIAPGEAPFDWRAEKVKAVSQLTQIFQDANTKKRLSLLVLTPFAGRFFRPGREFTSLSVEIQDPKTKQTLASATGKELKVIRNASLFPKEIPPGSTPPSSAVTLSIGEAFK